MELHFDHLVEVGCVRTLSLHNFIAPDNRLEVIEANPRHVNNIREEYRDYPNVQVFPFAIADQPGQVTFYDRGILSFVKGIASPALENFNYTPRNCDTVVVEARLFSDFDDGTIDFIDIDIEGSEWFVLQHMISRPRYIAIETSWERYTNPYIGQIEQWMEDNGYEMWAKPDATAHYRLK